MEPEVLVLDEPSSNLDPASRRELADILRSLDVTVLMVTHDLPYALELCPRSVILSDGVVAADGPTADILGDDALMKAHRLELPSASTRGSPPALAADRRQVVVVDRLEVIVVDGGDLGGVRGGAGRCRDQLVGLVLEDVVDVVARRLEDGHLAAGALGEDQRCTSTSW